ncbi:hypothetical protein N7509_000724 [Penicillium cosmopolitanum]|uniref:Uncharacterized protein n=1 Tax=Penicillium cosmopolitanum TaxID=1131564 RepID=A0A9W9WB45_9EURO|nr:uncharacterized protein N7509_000724 [Penicillium cosmopolitanum]KAJ5414097.1 hypothetical protein N7509_000724 [Penicillium cosmopolitanum]
MADFVLGDAFLAQVLGTKISNRITEVMLPYPLKMAKRIEEGVDSMMATIDQEKSFDLVPYQRMANIVKGLQKPREA